MATRLRRAPGLGGGEKLVEGDCRVAEDAAKRAILAVLHGRRNPRVIAAILRGRE